MRQKLKKLGLFGTRYTMQGGFYAEVFAKSGMVVIAPDADDQALIHDRYMNELVHAVFLSETRERLQQVGFEATPADAAAFDAFFRSEPTRWAGFIKERGLLEKP